MKKSVIISSIASVMLLSITGCGNSSPKLTCTMNQENEGATMTQTFEVAFQDNIASQIKSTTTLEVDPANEDQMENFESFKSSMEESSDNYESEGLKATYEIDDHIASMTIEANIAKMTDDEKESFGFSDDDDNSYETVKSNLESEGYTCK